MEGFCLFVFKPTPACCSFWSIPYSSHRHINQKLKVFLFVCFIEGFMFFRLALNLICNIKDDLELLTLLPLPLGFWNYRHITTLGLYCAGACTQSVLHVRQACYFLSCMQAYRYTSLLQGEVVKIIQIYSHLCYNTVCVFLKNHCTMQDCDKILCLLG